MRTQKKGVALAQVEGPSLLSHSLDVRACNSQVGSTLVKGD